MSAAPAYDPELLDALGRVFAEAALEKLIAEAQRQAEAQEEQTAVLNSTNGGNNKIKGRM